MESRFAHLRQRDSTVDMLRVKMSRRRSQSQKENRHRAVNSRRQLDRLPELECSTLDASVTAHPSVLPKSAQNVKRCAAEERVKMLARYKEAKELQKEKQKREREKKGVFKVGLYHPTQFFQAHPTQFFQAPAAMTKTKAPATAADHGSRVTRSMRNQPAQSKVQEAPTERVTASAATARKVAPAAARMTRSRAAAVKAPPPAPTTRTRVEPVARAPSTRSARRHQEDTAPANMRPHPTRAPPPDPASPPQASLSNPAPLTQAPPPDPASPPQASLSNPAPLTQAPRPDPAPAPRSSFAPRDFVFQAPVGLSSFKFNPLTPRSAESFLTPSISFSLPPAPLFPRDEPETEAGPGAPSPPASPPRSPSRPSPPSVASPQEPQHDVAYFRSVMVRETDRLTELSEQWDPRVDDPSIPEEMRDRMRTAVGQARLLMKERFGQFRGLVDDCELSRGEKITTCTDLQGFWEMVYYQVEDVNRKFAALKEAETRGWQEPEAVKPPPRQRKAVKKPAAAAASKPGGGPGANTAPKSRLGALKAAMKAKLQAAEAEKAAKATGSAVDDPAPQEPPGLDPDQSLASDTVVFNGGFFRVESPAKFPGPVRRSTCVLAQPSPAARTRCSNAASPRAPPFLLRTPTRLAPAGLRFSSATPLPSAPSTPARQERAASPDARDAGTPLTTRLYPGLPLSPPGHGPESSSPTAAGSPALSFSLSPRPSQAAPTGSGAVPPPSPPPPLSSPGLRSSSSSSSSSPPAVQSSPPALLLHSPGAGDSSLFDAEVPPTVTPDCSISDGVEGLDFERYLQPATRCSLSPRETVAVEMLSPAAPDVEMESPAADHGGAAREGGTTTAFPCVAQMFIPGTPQAAESDLLLFSPHPRDRIRQSVCPGDLMFFTPPR